MTRSKRDRRVTEILTAFDRFAASPERTADASLLGGFMETVVGTVHERFTVPCDWPIESMRAVLLAFLAHAPATDLEAMHELALSETSWIDEYEIDAAYERATGRNRSQRKQHIESAEAN